MLLKRGEALKNQGSRQLKRLIMASKMTTSKLLKRLIMASKMTTSKLLKRLIMASKMTTSKLLKRLIMASKMTIPKPSLKLFNSQGKNSILKILVAFFFLIPFFSLGKIDFESYLRFRTIGQQVQNSDQRAFTTAQTFRLKGIIRPSEIFETHFWLSSFSDFGRDSDESFGKNLEDSLRFYAFGKWNISKELSLRMGRVPYETSFHQILSSNSYEPYLSVFEGLFFNYSTNLIHLDLWGAHMPKQWLGFKEIRKLRYGTGVFLDVYSISEFLNHVNFHLVYLSDAFFEPDSQKTTRYGIAIDGNLTSMKLDYKLMGVAHGSGFKFRSEQSMYHIELAYSQSEWYGSRIFAGYHSDTENYDPWLYDRHQNAGLLDLFSWGNLTYFYLGYKVSFSNLFDVRLTFHDMKSTDSGPIHFGRHGVFLVSEDGSILNKEVSEGGIPLGRELDITLTKKINEEFELNLLLGGFFPSENSENLFQNEEAYTNIQLTGLYKF